jgi:PAS domain S-box-containing protein
MRRHEDQPPEGDPAPSNRPDFSDGFFGGMVAAASDAVVTADAEGTIVYANEAVEDLLGYAPDDLLGAAFTEFVPERFEDRYESWHRRYAGDEDGTPLSDETVELTWLTASGGEQRLSVSTFAHRDGGERLVTGFLREAGDGDATDERLREEETLVRELFDTSPIAIAVRDADGELLRANDRAAELVGVGTDDFPADVDDYEGSCEWTVYDEDGDPLPREAFPSTRATETGDPVFNEELVVERSDGSRVWLSVNATPVGPGDEVRQVVVTAEDITELKETGPPGRVYCSRLSRPYLRWAVRRDANILLSDRDRAGAFYKSFATTSAATTAPTVEPMRLHHDRGFRGVLDYDRSGGDALIYSEY